MKEFIIKNDEIHLFKKKTTIKKDFKFVTNDNKNQVKVRKSVGRFTLPNIIDKRQKKKIVFSDVGEYDYTHNNYLRYLDMAYSYDCGIVVKPDFIWFTVLCEVSSIIKGDPEKFRKYFSNEQEKQKIEIHVDGGNVDLPVNEILDEVMKRIPSSISEELIVPKFSTLDDDSEFAFKII
jgi:hypothetical protein